MITVENLTRYGAKIEMVLGKLRDFHDLQSANLFSDSHLLWMIFCKQLRHEHAADKTFVHKTLWVDEAHFRRDVLFNLKQSHNGTR
jgi:hypothetical protein